MENPRHGTNDSSSLPSGRSIAASAASERASSAMLSWLLNVAALATLESVKLRSPGEGILRAYCKWMSETVV